MSELQLINIKKLNKQEKELYKEAFPANERIPIFILKHLAKKDKADFYGIYDDEKFVGIIYIIYYKDIVFISYFAISNKFRGNGYGGRVIDLIKNKYKENRIILNIEVLDEKASNNKQRIRRKAFYEKCGFKDLGYFIKEGDEKYEMLCFSKDDLRVEKEEYMNLMENFFGKFLFKIYKKISQ